MNKLTLIAAVAALTLSTTTAQAEPVAQVAVGSNYYLEAALKLDKTRLQVTRTDDYYLASVSRNFFGVDVGLGYGEFKHTFSSSDDGVFNSDMEKDDTAAIYLSYTYSNLFITAVFSEPSFSSSRTHVSAPVCNAKGCTSVTSSREDKRATLETYVSVGLRFNF